jgi:hypothetical protein
MTWDPITPLTSDDAPTRTAGNARASLLAGILRWLRTSRVPLVFAASVQFVTAAVAGIVMIGVCLLQIAFKSAEDIYSRTDPAEYVASGILVAGAGALHVILGIGILRRRRWAMETAVCLSLIYLMVAYLLATFLRSDDPLSWLQRAAIVVFALIISADVVTLLQLKRAD